MNPLSVRYHFYLILNTGYGISHISQEVGNIPLSHAVTAVLKKTHFPEIQTLKPNTYPLKKNMKAKLPNLMRIQVFEINTLAL